jgi:hypothetical protein
VAADLHAGREPRSSTISAEGLTVKQLCNHYLTYQHRRSPLRRVRAPHAPDARSPAKGRWVQSTHPTGLL